MCIVTPLAPANDDASLFEQFADRVVTSATSRGLPAGDVARALLAKSANVLIDELGAEECGRFLGAVAMRILGDQRGG